MTDWIAALATERQRLAALAGTDLGATVPACPDWDVAALLVHLGRVHRWATAAIDLPVDADWPRFGARPADDDDLLTWLDAGLDSLLAAFAGADPARPCWGFAGPATVGWWQRRQALETAVHRWDAEQATGTPTPLDGELAVGGIDEWCELQAARWFTPEPDLTASVHLHATDGDGEWLLRATPDGFTWEHGHHKGDVAVRASRSDLYLLVWNRVAPGPAVEVLGDPALLDRVLRASAVD